MAKKKKKDSSVKKFLLFAPVVVVVVIIIFSLFNFQIFGFSDSGFKVRQPADTDKSVASQLEDIISIDKITYVEHTSGDTATYSIYCYSETGGIMYLGDCSKTEFTLLSTTLTITGNKPVEFNQVSLIFILFLLAIGIATPICVRRFLYGN